MPRPSPAARGSRRRPRASTVDHGADLDLVALLDLDLLDDARHRRGHFDRGLVGLEFQDRLIARDRVADVDEHAGHVAAGDVLSQFGNFEFGHPSRSTVYGLTVVPVLA